MIPDNAGLPLTRSLDLAYWISLALAVLMATASLIGVLFPSVVYPTAEVLAGMFPTDVANLLFGLPLLLLSLWLVRRAKLVGLLCWSGALFYLLYVYFPYLFLVPFGLLFIPHLVLVTASAYTLIGLLAGVDGEAVRQRLEGRVPVRIAAGILILLASFNVIRHLVFMFAALRAGNAVHMSEVVLWIDDLAVACPAMFIGGILLWQRRPMGYVIGSGLLLQYGMLAVGLIPYLLLQPRLAGTLVESDAIVAVLLMAVVCFVPFAFFIRGASKRRGL